MVFTRRPDYFDGQAIPAIIHFQKDISKEKIVPFAYYQTGGRMYAIDAAYLFKNYRENEQIKIIYEASNPAQAGIYSWWGYWLRWQELLSSLIIYSILFYAAITITKKDGDNEMPVQENAPVKRKKYAD